MSRTLLLYCFSFLSFGLIAQPQADFVADTTEGCAPFQVNFTNLSTNANQYEWDFGDGNSSTILNPSNLYLQPDTYSVKLIARSAAGIDSLIRQSYIIVHDVPQLNYTFSDSIQCLEGDSISFVNLGDTANAYTWSFGDGNGSSDYEPIYTYQDTGIYQTTLFAESPYGCRNTFSLNQTIRVKGNPVVDFQLDTSLVCNNGVPVHFTSLAGTSLEHYWDFGDGNSDSTNRITQHIYQLEGIYDVKLKVKDTDGCISVEEKKKAVQFHIPEPLSVFVSSDSVCSNQEVQFKIDSSWANIQWTLGDGSTSKKYDFSYDYLQEGKYLPSVIAFDSVGCKQELTLDSIQILQSPIADFEDTTSNYCLPLSISLQNNSIFAQAFQWKLGPFTSTQENPIFSFTQAGSFDLELIAKNEICSDTLKQLNYLKIEHPFALIRVSDSVGCAPHQVIFSLENAEDFGSIRWFFGNGDSAVNKRARYTYEFEGKYKPYVITETKGGCLDTAYYTPKIQVEDAQSVFNQPDTIFVCRSSFVDFEGSSIGGDFWQWSFGDGDSSSLANPTHLFDSAGIYEVDLLTKNTLGCYYRLEPYNVVVVADPKADFTLNRNNCPNFEMRFIANAPGATEFLWDFGDGTTDSVANPIHYYSGPGFYNVSLKAWYPNGCFAEKTLVNAVQMLPCIGNDSVADGASGPGNRTGAFKDTLQPILACAPYTIQFNIPRDSLLNIWWDFGDGDTSQSFHPTHTYHQRGNYTVELIVEDVYNQFDTVRNVNYVQLGDPISDFNFLTVNACNNSEVEFINNSSFATNYEWNLGSAGMSFIENPKVNYNQASNELIELIAKDNRGCFDKSYQNISLGSPNPYFDFESQLCLGDTITFASNVNSYDSYIWKIGSQEIVGDTVQFIAEDTGRFTVQIRAYDSSNCYKTFTSPKVLVISDPKANFTFNDVPESCDYYDLNITNLSTGSSSYKWILGNGDTLFEKDPNYRYLDSGLFKLQLLADKDGCVDYSSVRNVIVNKAVADFEVQQNSFCLPIDADFLDLSKAAVSWKWKFGDGDSSIQQNPQHTFNVEPENQILTIIDTNGCEATVSKNAIKTHQASPQADRWEGCVPLQIQFSDSTKNVTSFFWDFGDGNFSNQQFPIHTYAVPGTYDLTLITQSVEGCYDTSIIENAVVAGSVKADFITNADANACAPHMAVFENNSKGAVNYHWSFGDNKTSSKEQPIHVYHKAGVFDVKLIADNGFSCTDTLVKTKRFNINTPEIAFSMSDSVFCGASEVEFIDLSKRVANRRWFFGDGSTTTDRNPRHVYNDVKKYTVSLVVTDTAGCVENLSKEIRLKRKPIASFSLDSTYGCIPAKIAFRNHSSELEQPTYTWSLNNMTFNAEDTLIEFNEQNLYDINLIVENANGCSDTSFKEDHLRIYEKENNDYPIVKGVSRSEFGDWTIEWVESKSFNFKYYQIYRKNSTGDFEPFVKVWNQNESSYQISFRSAWGSRQCFKVEVVKYCSDQSIVEQIPAYCSIDLSVRKESNHIVLNWTDYPIEGRLRYEVYRKKWGANSYQLIGINDTSTLKYVDSTILCPEIYVYRVKLLSEKDDYSVWSDTVNILPNDLVDTFNVELKRISVVNEKQVLLEWESLSQANEIANSLYLSKKNSRGSYSIIENLPLTSTSYLDENSQLNSQPVEYKLSLANSCKREYNIEGAFASIYLKIDQEGELIKLRWTKVKGLKSGVDYYLIQQQLSNGDWKTIKQLGKEEFGAEFEFAD